MFKKLSAAVISGVMLISSAAPMALAEKDNKMEEVLVSVKQRISIPAECSEFESGSYTSWDYTHYTFSWTTPWDSETSEHFNVECTEDKVITDYYHYKQNDKIRLYTQEPAFPKQERSAMEKRAREFIKQLNPDVSDKIVIESADYDSLFERSYSFSLHREENGIPVDQSYGYLSFDEANEYVTSFNISWLPAKDFPIADDVLSRGDAQKEYTEKLGMELVYANYYDKDEMIFYPVYRVKETDKYINALTGEVVEPKRSFYGRFSAASGKAFAQEAAEDTGNSIAFTEQEIEELDKISGLISKTDIEKAIRKNKLLDIPKDAALERIVLIRKSFDKQTYLYYLTFRDSDDTYISVTADAKNGEIFSYYSGGRFIAYKDSSAESEEKEFDREKADEALKTLTPSKCDEFEYVKDGSYARVENGIKVISDTANVSFNDAGGLSSYFLDYTENASFPSVEGVISAEDAAAGLFDAADYEMKYMLDAEDEGVYNPVLVYDFDETYYINPFTGKPVNYRNEEIDEEKPIEYDDIDTHYAKDKIEKLARFKIGFEGGKFLPDEKITQKEYLTLVSKAFRSYIDEDDVYEYALNRDWIKEEEKNENAPLTREMAAVILIRAIGADKYADYEDIYVKPFKDVSEYKGYIGLLSAMGIVEGDDDGNFNPKNNLSRAEAAIMLYNYLVRE